MHQSTTRVIVNPSAAAGRAGARVATAQSILNARWPNIEWCVSQSAHHLAALCRSAVDAGFARVIVAGGDGSVHHALPAMAGSHTALGILPVGTGNDFAQAAGIPSTVDAAARVLIDGRIVQVDLGCVGEQPFCCVAGIGLDTPALRLINASRMRRGQLLYQYAALKTLLSYRAGEMRIDVEGCVEEGAFIFAAISNTPTYAGGYRISPHANIADGRLNYCLFREQPLLQRLTTFARLRSGLHVGRVGVRSGTTVAMHLDASPTHPVTLDGELTTITTPIDVKILPGALRLICPT